MLDYIGPGQRAQHGSDRTWRKAVKFGAIANKFTEKLSDGRQRWVVFTVAVNPARFYDCPRHLTPPRVRMDRGGLACKDLAYGRDDHRLRLCGTGHGHLPGGDRAHRARRGEGYEKAQDADGRALPDLRAGLTGTDAGALCIGAVAVHGEREGGGARCGSGVSVRGDATQTGRDRGHELSGGGGQGSVRRAGGTEERVHGDDRREIDGAGGDQSQAL